MTRDRVALLVAAGALLAWLGSGIADAPSLLVLAYALAGVGAWLLVGDRVSLGTRLAGGGVLVAAAVGLLLYEGLTIGFRGRPLAHLGLGVEANAWEMSLLLAPLLSLAAGLWTRTESWGRLSAAVGLGIGAVGLAIVWGVSHLIAVGRVRFPLLAVFLAVVASLVSFGRDVERSGPIVPAGRS